MKVPTHCVLWEKPELIHEPKDKRFELIETFVDESHLWRYLLKCRECGQLYFFEFYEEVDWEGGDDPQYSTYIPVETDEEIGTLKSTSPHGLLGYLPQLRKDFPKDAKTSKVYWVR